MNDFELSPAAKQYLDDIAQIAGYLWQRGWAVKNGGNISVNVTGEVTFSASILNRVPYTNLDHAYPELST